MSNHLVALLMSFLRVPLFTLISYYLLLHLGFCKVYQNCLVAIIKITTVSDFGALNASKTVVLTEKG